MRELLYCFRVCLLSYIRYVIIAMLKFPLEFKRTWLSLTLSKDDRYSGRVYLCTLFISLITYQLWDKDLRFWVNGSRVCLSPGFNTWVVVFVDWETGARETVVRAALRTSWSIRILGPGAARIQTAPTETWSPPWLKPTASAASACWFEETARPAARAWGNCLKPVNNTPSFS